MTARLQLNYKLWPGLFFIRKTVLQWGMYYKDFRYIRYIVAVSVGRAFDGIDR